jgi:hypothetical protein
MKRVILCICLITLCTASVIGKPQQLLQTKQDTTVVKNPLRKAAESLDKRDFSKDVESLKIKTDSLVKEYTPEVKGFINSLGEYFKR